MSGDAQKVSVNSILSLVDEPEKLLKGQTGVQATRFDSFMPIQPMNPPMVKASFAAQRDAVDPEYLALAARIGMDNYAVRMASLNSFLAEHDMGFYKEEDVRAYLKTQVPKGKIWVWKPLRESDMQSVGFGNPGYEDGDYDGRLYQRAVPLHVLAVVSAIESKMPNNFDFLVSDFETPAPRPDPFLAVAARGMREQPWRVIFHWDEPDFKGGFATQK
jgi:hypothetical protein